MADTKHLSPDATGLQSWETFVDDQLERIWAEATDGRPFNEVAAVTDLVLLRMLEWTDGEHAFRDLGHLLDVIVGSVVHEESERARRRLAWQRNLQAPPPDDEPAGERPS